MVYTLNRSLYFLIPLALVLDLILWGLMQVPVGCFSQALLFALVSAHAPLIALVLAGFLALWYRFILTGTLGMDLLTIIPLCLGYYYAFAVADIPRPFMVAAIWAGLLLQRVLFGVSIDPEGLFLSFLSSLIMVYLVIGSQGNRLRT